MTNKSTSELEGAALDWAVSQVDPICEGLSWSWDETYKTLIAMSGSDGESEVCAFLRVRLSSLGPKARMEMIRDGATYYRPSADWSQGGPLIEKFSVTLNENGPGNWWSHCGSHLGEGVKPLIAAMRAIVANSLGDTVDIPAEIA